MTSIKLIVTGASAMAEVDGLLTSGMVGIPVTIVCDGAWDGLTKAVVCRAGSIVKTILNVGGTATVAHECMVPNQTLFIGIEGRNADGTLVIPTVWARCGLICSGATTDADPSADPTLPIWAQIESKIGSLDDLNTQAKENLVAAINEAARTGGGAGSMDLRVADGYVQYSSDGGMTWTNLIAMADLKGDQGEPGKDGHSPVVTATKSGKTTTISVDGAAIATVEDGADGKSAYQYAVEGGFTGTEAEFAAKLAAEIPTVDETLTKSGQAADAAAVGNRLSALSEEIANKSGADYTFLNGLKYYACGDSIVDMQGTLTAPETFGDSGYSTDLQGRSIGEVTVKGYVTAIERRYGLVATNYGKGGHTLVGDYATLAAKDYSDVALVTIAYGVNDARTGVPLGTVNSTDTTTFAGAMNQLLRKIYTDNPECRVLVLSPMQRLTVTDFGIATPNANGNYLIDFVNMCKAIAEKRSTAFLDQYRCTGINQTNLYYYTVEGVHPVNQGFARIRNAVIGILDELFALEYEPIGVMTNTGGTEPDEPGTGGGGGDATPPGEDTGATEVEVVSRLTKNGYYYDGYPDVTGQNIYKGIEFPLIELIDGKTYTLETYTDSNTHGRFGAVSVDENAKAGTYLSGGASSTGYWVITAVAEGVYKAVLTFVAGTLTVKVDGVPTKCLYLSFGCLNDYVSQAKLSYV